MKKVPRAAAANGSGFWRTHGWRILLLWALLLATYSDSFQSGLVFDNGPIISADPRIRHATPENLHSILTGQYWYGIATTGLYRPLTTLSYLMNYAILGGGEDPFGYHAINLAIHALNVSLAYALGISIFGDAILALSLAALWGVHPLLVESVTNIVGRADLLAAFGVLAGLLCAIRAASSDGRRRWAWLLGIVGAQAIGIFSKESALVLPAVILAHDLAWPAQESWKKRAAAYAVLVIPLAVFFAMRATSDAHLLVNFSENPLLTAGFWTARLTALSVIGRFLWIFSWPATLSADYSYRAIPLFGSSGATDALAIAAILCCASALFFAWRSRKQGPALFFCVLFFFVAIAPTANLLIIIGSIMAERFMYLGSLGLAGCVVLLLFRFLSPRTALIAAGILCVPLAARTYVRNLDWIDGVTLWSSAIAAEPDAARAHHNLAFELTRIPGRMDEAIAEYRAALRIRPDYPEAHFSLGNALRQTSRLPEAIAEYRAAVQNAPAYVEARNNLGTTLVEAGDIAGGISELEAVIRLRPDDPEPRNNLGRALARSGRLPEGILQLQTALRLRPDYPEAHENLGGAYFQLGKLTAAIAEFQSAIRIRPDYAEAHANLGSALFQSGRIPDAIAEYQTAIRLQPGMADAHFNLANALLEAGRIQEAVAELQTVQKIHPDPEVSRILDRIRK